jgi:hypothetical protein
MEWVSKIAFRVEICSYMYIEYPGHISLKNLEWQKMRSNENVSVCFGGDVWDVWRGPKVTSLVARGRCAQHLRRIRGCDAHPAHMSRKCYAQNSRTMCVICSPRIMKIFCARSAQQGILLLDPSVCGLWKNYEWFQHTYFMYACKEKTICWYYTLCSLR